MIKQITKIIIINMCINYNIFHKFQYISIIPTIISTYFQISYLKIFHFENFQKYFIIYKHFTYTLLYIIYTLLYITQ